MPADLIIGVTGTRHGMTDAQGKTACRLLLDHQPAEVNHGDCVGADEQFHLLTLVNLPVSTRIVIHPPTKDVYRAFCATKWPQEERSITEWEPRGYLYRNHRIVEAAGLVLATPQSMESRRGGTWYTVDYAKQLSVPTIVICPYGSIEERG